MELDDGFILSGHSGDSINPKVDRDIAIGLVKTYLNGLVQWYKEFEFSDGWDGSYSFCKTNDGGYLITGYKEIY